MDVTLVNYDLESDNCTSDDSTDDTITNTTSNDANSNNNDNSNNDSVNDATSNNDASNDDASNNDASNGDSANDDSVNDDSVNDDVNSNKNVNDIISDILSSANSAVSSNTNTRYCCIYNKEPRNYKKSNELIFIKLEPINDLFVDNKTNIDKDKYVKINDNYLQYNINSSNILKYSDTGYKMQNPKNNNLYIKDVSDIINKNPGKHYLITFQKFQYYNKMRQYLQYYIHNNSFLFDNKRLSNLIQNINKRSATSSTDFTKIYNEDDCKFMYEFMYFIYNVYDNSKINIYSIKQNIAQYKKHLNHINNSFTTYYNNIQKPNFTFNINSIKYSNSRSFLFTSGNDYIRNFQLHNDKLNIITNEDLDNYSFVKMYKYFQTLYSNYSNNNNYKVISKYSNSDGSNSNDNLYTLYNYYTDYSVHNKHIKFINQYLFGTNYKNCIKLQYDSDITNMNNNIDIHIYLVKYSMYINKEIYNRIFISKIKNDSNLVHNNWIYNYFNSVSNLSVYNNNKFGNFYNYNYKKECMKYFYLTIPSSKTVTDLNNFINKKYNSVSHKSIRLNQKNIKLLKTTPFSYQIDNLKWMYYIEKNNSSKDFKYICNVNFIKIMNTPFIFKNVIDNYGNCHNYGNIIHLNEKESIKYTKYIKLSGGILADEVGLGKTLSTISHIVNSYNFDTKKREFDANNMIITPNRLVSQWYTEINKYFTPALLKLIPVIKITTINDIKKKLYNIKLNKYGIYIISSNLISNDLYHKYLMHDCYDINKYHKFIKALDKKVYKSYHKLINTNLKKYKTYDDFASLKNKELNDELNMFKLDNKKKFNIFSIKWNRIIVDEAHEVLTNNIIFDDKYSTFEDSNTYYANTKDNVINFKISKPRRYKCLLFNKLVSNYKWCLTATPFKDNLANLYCYINFLNNDYNEKINVNYNKFNEMTRKEKSQYLLNVNNGNFYDITCNGIEKALFSLNNKQLQSFYKYHIRQTTKKDIKGIIDIPIFTEEITYLKQNYIERNIYLQALRFNDVKRLLQLCTHIMVSDNDITTDDNNGVEFGSTILNLNQIKNIMIKKYKLMKSKNVKFKHTTNDTLVYLTNRNNLINTIINLLKNYDFNNNNSQYYINTNTKTNINTLLSTNENNINYRRQFSLNDINLIKNIRDIIIEDDPAIRKFSEDFNQLLQCINILQFPNVIINNLNKHKLFTIYKMYSYTFNNDKSKINDLTTKYNKYDTEIKRLDNQIAIFEDNSFIKDSIAEPCSICFEAYSGDKQVCITSCRHVMCSDCIKIIFSMHAVSDCPFCRTRINKKDIYFTSYSNIMQEQIEAKKEVKKDNKVNTSEENVAKYGTKLGYLLDYIGTILSTADNRIIIFSQYDRLLRLIGVVLEDFKLKTIFVKGNIMSVSKSINLFKTDSSYRIIMLSSEKANSGCNLTEATHIIFADVINGDAKLTKDLESQAIGRAVRIGQKKPVIVKRLIMQDTVEEDIYNKNKYDMTELQM